MPEKMFLRIAMVARVCLWALLLAAVLFGKNIIESNVLNCFWVERFGMECATCGASRAVVSLFSGDFSAAVAWNPVVTLALVPVFGFFLLSDLFVMVWNLFGKKRRLSPLEYCFSVFGATFRPAETKKGAS